MAKKRFHVFVDETGDRSLRPKASRVFAVSAVIVPDTHVQAAHVLLDLLNTEFGKPPGTTLHWSTNLKQHIQRKHVARTLARAHLAVTNVLVVKNALPTSTRLYDGTSIYNYAIRRLLERVSWLAHKRNGEVTLTFAHIKNFPYTTLFEYIERLRAQETTIRWGALPSRPRLDQPSRVRGLQLADMTAGMISAAVVPDQHGDFEASYLNLLIPRLYRGERGVRRRSVASYGMNVVGRRGCMDHYPWWRGFVSACS